MNNEWRFGNLRDVDLSPTQCLFPVLSVVAIYFLAESKAQVLLNSTSFPHSKLQIARSSYFFFASKRAHALSVSVF
jgi:hypothetical protein